VNAAFSDHMTSLTMVGKVEAGILPLFHSYYPGTSFSAGSEIEGGRLGPHWIVKMESGALGLLYVH